MNIPHNDVSLTELSTLNVVDWLLVVLLTWSVVFAFIRGLIRELFSLAGLIFGIPIAARLYPRLAPQLDPVFTSPAIAQTVAFLLIAIGTMVVCGLLGRILSRTARALGIGFFDRVAGAFFGLVRGALIGVTLVMAATAFLPQPQLLLVQSHFAPYFLAAAREVSFVVPQALQWRISSGVNGILRGSDVLRHR
jgi:membrane protein required for colicin V production